MSDQEETPVVITTACGNTRISQRKKSAAIMQIVLPLGLVW